LNSLTLGALPAAGVAVSAGWANDDAADDERARTAMGCWAVREMARRAEVERIIVGGRGKSGE
jgi:hypothetical protein